MHATICWSFCNNRFLEYDIFLGDGFSPPINYDLVGSPHLHQRDEHVQMTKQDKLLHAMRGALQLWWTLLVVNVLGSKTYKVFEQNMTVIGVMTGHVLFILTSEWRDVRNYGIQWLSRPRNQVKGGHIRS